MGFIKSFSERFRQKHPTFWQFAVFLFMGAFTGIVDLVTFALCNYWIFRAYAAQPFRWWVFDYGVENGGLCAFLAFAVSFAVSQTFNFFIQRKATFKATNNAVVSGIMYAVMVVGVYLVVLWMPAIVGAPLYALFGNAVGAIVLKLFSQTVSALIQFPINKWVIMRGK